MKKKLKIAAFVVLALFVLCILAAVVVTRPFFIKGQILPRVAKAAGTPIVVKDPDSAPAAAYLEMAKNMQQQIRAQAPQSPTIKM